MKYDAIVVGVGGMGSATAYHLARRGSRVLGLEQSNIPNELGSSHGITRIIRLGYAEGPNYIPLLRRAYELWRELENLVGKRILIITGGIDAGLKDSNMVSGVLHSCNEYHIPYEVLENKTLRKRFPGYRLPANMVGVYQPDSGFLLSERCIVAHVLAAQNLGAEIHARERVLKWCASAKGVSIETDRGSYQAKMMVVTAGPWARTIIPALKDIAIPQRQVLIWTQPCRPEYFRLGAFPIFNMEAPEGRFYGFPIYEVPGFKIGKYNHLYQNVDPDKMDRECHPEDEDVLRTGIRTYFPDADGPTMGMKTCLFTNSPDENFILDVHPEYPHVAIAAGFSGHGFKFCSVIGEIMAELVINGKTRQNINMFRLSRPSLKGNGL